MRFVNPVRSKVEWIRIMKPRIDADAVLSGAEGLTRILLATENTEATEK